MIFLARLLCLLISFELFTANTNFRLLIDNAVAEECEAGMVRSSSGRCTLSETSVDNALGAKECASITDTEAKKACYKQVTSQNIKDGENPHSSKLDWRRTNLDGTGSAGAAILTSFSIAVPLIFLSTAMINKKMMDQADKDQFKCRPTSLMLSYAAAGVLGAGEIISIVNHRSKMKQIKKDWEKLSSTNSSQTADQQNTSAYELATKAWEYQANEEKQVEKTTNLKQGYYTASAALFSGAALMASIEGFELRYARKRMEALNVLLKAKIALLDKQIALMMVPQTAAAATPVAQGLVNEILLANENYAKHVRTINRITCGTRTLKSAKAIDMANYSTNSALNAFKEQQEKNAEKHETETKQDIAGINNYLFQNLALRKKILIIPQLKAFEPQLNLQSNFLKTNNLSLASKVGFKLSLPGFSSSTTSVDKELPIYSNPWNNHFKNGVEALLNVKYKRNSYNLFVGADNALEIIQAIEEIESEKSSLFNLENYRESSLFGALEDIKIDPSLAEQLGKIFTSTAYANMDSVGPSNKISTEILPKGDITGFLTKVTNELKFSSGKPITAGELEGINKQMNNGWNRFIFNPWTRFVAGGLLATWTGVMADAMKHQSNLAKTRSEELMKFQNDFLANNKIMGCTEALRNDSSQPQCYCYTSENKINPARSSHSACKGIASNAPNSLTYLSKTDQTKACVDQQFGLDPKCSCKNRKNSNGGNNCLNVNVAVGSGIISPSTFKMLGGAIAPANDILSGNASGADIGVTAGANAAKIMKIAEEVQEKNIPGSSAKIKDEMNKLGDNLKNSFSGIQMSSGLKIASNPSPIQKDPKKAVDELQNSLKESMSVPEYISASEVAPDNNLLNEIEEAPAETEESQIAEVMAQDLDYGNNDISNQSTGNIFDLLSNRYQRSGMRRLFDESSSSPSNSSTNNASEP